VLAFLLDDHCALEVSERIYFHGAICTHHTYGPGILMLWRRVEVRQNAQLLGELGPTESHGQGVVVGYFSVIVVEH